MEACVHAATAPFDASACRPGLHSRPGPGGDGGGPLRRPDGHGARPAVLDQLPPARRPGAGGHRGHAGRAGVRAPGRRGRDRGGGVGAGGDAGHAAGVRLACRRALLRLRRALGRGRAQRAGDRELRLGRAGAAGGLPLRQGQRAPVGRPRAHGRHLLPGAVAAVQPRLRRADRRGRDQPLRHHRRRPLVGATSTARGCGCACSRARRRRARCGASRRAVGRQPAPQAPWTFGPWFQTGQPNVVPVEEERAITAAQRGAGAPVSVAETQMHYLPCGAHKGREAAERERTDSFHRDGLARLVYFNPLLCASYSAVFARAAAAGVLQRGALGRAVPLPGVRRRVGPAGLHPGAAGPVRLHPPGRRGLLRRPGARGGGRRRRRLDGGLRRVHAAGSCASTTARTGDAAHNRYPTDYHCALAADRAELRPPARALPALGLDRQRRAAPRWSGAATRPRSGASTGSARP